MDTGALREEALALNKQGADLMDAIQKGEEPFEKFQEAERMLKEAGEKIDLATGSKAALEAEGIETDGQAKEAQEAFIASLIQRTKIQRQQIEEL